MNYFRKSMLFILSLWILGATAHAQNLVQCEGTTETVIDEQFSEDACNISNDVDNNIIQKENNEESDLINGKVKKALNHYNSELKSDISALNKKIETNDKKLSDKKTDIDASQKTFIESKKNSIKEKEDKIKEYEAYIQQYQNDPKKASYVESKKKSIQTYKDNIAKTQQLIDTRISTDKTKLDEATKKHQTVNDELVAKKGNLERVQDNVETKGTQIALNSIKKECKGLFKQGVFSEGDIVLQGKVNIPSKTSTNKTNSSAYSWVDETGTTQSLDAKKVLGIFNTFDEAQGFVNGLYANDPNVVRCDIDHALEKQLTAFPETMILEGQNLSKVNQAGDSFPDNGMNLNVQSPKANEAWDGSVDKWKKELETYTDDRGRKVERNLREVKIYSCASMFSNCVNSKENRKDYENSCDILDFVRDAFQSKFFSMSSFNDQIDNDKSSLSKSPVENDLTTIGAKYKTTIGAKYKSLSAEDKALVKRLFAKDSPMYSSMKELAKNNNGFENDFYSPITNGGSTSGDSLDSISTEQMTFLALSSLRGMNMADQFFKDVGAEKENVKVTIVPTGHPDDPFNNSKINPNLAGTCGPLPPNGSLYGQCNQNKKACTKYSKECSDVRKYYEREDVKKLLDQKINSSYLGQKYPNGNIPNQEKYSFHRYYQIEPLVDETVTDKIEKTIDVDRYFVSCRGIKFRCKDTTPEINFSGSFTVGNSGGKTSGGGGGGCTTCCPTF